MTNIVQFPPRNKGRVRKSTSANAEGMLAIHQFEAGGQNVEIFNERREEAFDRTDFMAYFLQTIFNSLPADTRQAVRLRASCDAALGKTDHDRIAGAVLTAMFRGDRHAD